MLINKLEYSLDGDLIPMVKIIKYLRIYLKNSLEWEAQVNRPEEHGISYISKPLTKAKLKI